MFAANVFTAFTFTLDVRHLYMRFVDVGGSVVLGVVGTSVGPVGFDVGPIQSPNRVLAFY